MSPVDPLISQSLYALCLEGTAGVWREQRSKLDEDRPPATVYTATGKVTGTFSNWLVLQSEGHARLSRSTTHSQKDNRDVATDSAILQLGNSAVYRHRLFGGRSRIPFGLNINANGNWSGFEKSNWFFGEPIRLLGYTYDNQRDLIFTVSVGSRNEESSKARERSSAFGVRVMYDMAALEGTRAIVSFSTTELSERHASIALINHNGKGEETTVEIVRKWTQLAYDPTDFDQLIRVNWSGLAGENHRIKAQYEDILDDSRTGSVAYSYRLYQHVSPSLVIGYHKSEDRTHQNYWFGALGLEASL